MQRQAGLANRSTGFTLIEAAVVIGITAILASLALPSWRDFHQRQQLRSAADVLISDLRHARELSVSARSPVHVSYRAGKNWCWGVSQGQPCDCQSASPLPACSISRVDGAEFPGVAMDAAQDAEFSPGLLRAAQFGSVALRTEQGHNLQVVLTGLGRASSCGPDAPSGAAC
jgi:type IV fimbrial biogenesis protein FimT